MGNLPELDKTTIHPNRITEPKHIEFVKEYFAEEVEAGRMSGPYTEEEVRGILRLHFVSAPLLIDEKLVEDTFEMKMRMCINLSKNSKTQPLPNLYTQKSDFPTHYDPAAKVGDIVSIRSL